MSKVSCSIFLILLACSKTPTKIDFTCGNKSIHFSKTDEISVNNLPAMLINQKIAALAYELPEIFSSSPVVKVDPAQAGLDKPICTLDGITKFKIGLNNELSNTVYVSDYKAIHAVPKEALGKVSLNPLDYLKLFSEEKIDRFNLKEGNSNFSFTIKNNEWYLDQVKLDSGEIYQFLSELKSNKFTKSRKKKTPTYFFVTDLTVLEIEIGDGVWVSTPELPDTYLSSIPENFFHSGAAGLARDKKIFNFTEIKTVEINGFDKNIKLQKNVDSWLVNSQASDLVFTADYIKFLQDLKVFYFTDKKDIAVKSKITVNSSDVLEVGEYFVLPNADLGYYAKYKDKVFVLSERQIKKLFPNLEILVASK